MTTVCKKLSRCAVCGYESEYTGIVSTNTFFGSPDLDTRPPEMKRSTIFTWVQRCHQCGYCASDIKKAPTQASKMVTSPEYAQQISDLTFPELANSFLCKGLIDASSENYASSAWAFIHAAWACDDAEALEPAIACRSKAIDMIIKALQNRQMISEQQGADTALTVDLLRRTGRFQEAQQMILTKRQTITEDIITKILDFEDYLLKKEDKGRHTIAEALGANES